MFKGTYNRRVPDPPVTRHPPYEARARCMKKTSEGDTMIFDLYRYGELHQTEVQESTPPENVSVGRWDFLRRMAFMTFVGMEFKGRYKGKSWDSRAGNGYLDVLTREEITEIIVGQYYYDNIAGIQSRKLITKGMAKTA